MMNLFVTPIILMCLFLVNAPVYLGASLWLVLLAFVGIMGASLALLAVLGRRGRAGEIG